MSLLGIKQLASLAAPHDPRQPTREASEVFESLSDAAGKELDGAFKAVLDAGNSVQRQAVDLLPWEVLDPRWAVHQGLRLLRPEERV